MSTIQGEPKQSLRSTIIGGVIAVVVAAGAIGGVAVASNNARVQAEQLHLLANAKKASIAMEAATADDAALYASTQQAAAVSENGVLVAHDQAVADAKAAAIKAAAAKAAALAAQQAAAQQAAQQQTAQQSAPVQQAAAPSAPSAPASAGLPPGSPVPWIPSSDPNNSAGGSWDTQACASHNASGNPAVCD